MAEPKTKPHKGSVTGFIRSVENETRRDDALALLPIFETITGCKPVLWGPSIIGFGTYHYVYPTGNSGDWPITGFSPRKANLSIYIMPGFARYNDLMAKLGKHKTGKSCLYINKLDDIHIPTLKQLVKRSVAHIRKHYETAD